MSAPRPPLPNLIVAGVTKAGTTSLFSFLTAHPDVCGSDKKSTQHFLPLRFGQPCSDLDDYRAHFADCAGHRVIVEATPGYFYGGHAVADEIRRSLPAVKILIALREPVSRLISFYRFQKAMLGIPLDMPFDDYVERCLDVDAERYLDPALADPADSPWLGVHGGCYDRYLPAWLQFAPDIRFVYFEEFVSDPGASLTGLAPWLGISAEPFTEMAFPRENTTVVPRLAGVHRLALAARRRLDGTLRRHPALTSRLRSAYQWGNRSAADGGDLVIRPDLHELFRASNQATAGLLLDAGVEHLPSWLSPSSVGG